MVDQMDEENVYRVSLILGLVVMTGMGLYYRFAGVRRVPGASA